MLVLMLYFEVIIAYTMIHAYFVISINYKFKLLINDLILDLKIFFWFLSSFIFFINLLLLSVSTYFMRIKQKQL